MMDTSRRQKGENCNQDFTRTRLQNRKPPLGNWQPTVPAWEKKFCSSIGTIPWRRIMEMKRFTHLYDNVVKWNDSAGEEAFYNAKTRFYAQIHGLHCDISLPDPDVYIDEIDWDSRIDPELVLELDHPHMVPKATEKDECVVIFGNSLLADKGFSSSGWGDTQEVLKRATHLSPENNDNSWDRNCGENNVPMQDGGWGETGYSSAYWNMNNVAMRNAGWEDSCNNNSSWWNAGNVAMRDNGWEDSGNNSSSWNTNNVAARDNGWGDSGNHAPCWNTNNITVGDAGWGETGNYSYWNMNNVTPGHTGWEVEGNNSWEWDQYENNCGFDVVKDGNNGGWGTCYASTGKREASTRCMAGYRTSRFRADDHQRNQSWKNGSWRKKVNCASRADSRHGPKQWNLMNSCAPLSHHASGHTGNQWAWEKTVSGM